MINSPSNSEFVETAFTAEEVGNVESTKDPQEGQACAFLDGVQQPTQQLKKNQAS
ncbi:hypothetical protein BLA13014_04563 [Burkholderia aenigmatica]|uniref:Uncharacterized protein n=1 Tax=Burkholderia aenigmatica TaxID=2015348 RepID=A0A6P2NRQ3_9BURK|nr:hypothetical protein [Burkholderia aenigmatica]VWB97629.1 hypothetical protein BLA13014_04563 [Burkholderia aenigmatica]